MTYVYNAEAEARTNARIRDFTNPALRTFYALRERMKHDELLASAVRVAVAEYHDAVRQHRYPGGWDFGEAMSATYCSQLSLEPGDATERDDEGCYAPRTLMRSAIANLVLDTASDYLGTRPPLADWSARPALVKVLARVTPRIETLLLQQEDLPLAA